VDKRDLGSFVWVYPIVFVLTLLIFAGGIYLAATEREWTLLAAGCVSITLVLVSWPLGLAIKASREAADDHLRNQIAPVNERLQQFSESLAQLSEHQLLSDRAKSVAYREKEREALRRALQEDVVKQDWEAALVLADEMEKSFGYKQEADRYRQQINERRNEAARRQINDAISVIDRHTRAEQWQVAQREAERLMQIYPTSEQVRNLPSEIEARRLSRKRQLLDSWNEAVARRDVDGSIEILKKLDAYLTPAEAESMQETARSVFKQKLENLRTQFSMAVQDHRWQEAIQIGDTIIRDFPNSQMAKEVRDTMDALRERARDSEMAGA
jgi:hypothetical protein